MNLETGNWKRETGGRSISRLVALVGTVCLFLVSSSRAAEEASFLRKMEIDVHGFVDVRAGVRTQNDSNEKDTSLGEARFQLDLERMGDLSTIKIRSDFLYDDVPENRTLDLEDGTGAIDLREMNILVSPVDLIDVKM